jgi:hypothetical protein
MAVQVPVRYPTVAIVKEALKAWHSESQSDSPLSQLYQFRRIQRETGRSVQQTIHQLLIAALDVLYQAHPVDAQFLQLRFVEEWSVSQLARHYHVVESTIYVMQREAISRLTTTLGEMEAQARAGLKERLLHRLHAPTYGTLIGVAAQLQQLLGRLQAPQPPWVVAIEGLGGIGKTALADIVVRQLIEAQSYDEIAWVSAQQNRLNLGGALAQAPQPALTAAGLVEALVNQLLPGISQTTGHSGRMGTDDLLPRLRTLLKQVPHLLVIDNLETLVDLESLLPTLQDLANPSKFLLTSRQSLYDAPNIYHFKVPELSEAHALHLIRQEATLSNQPTLAAAADAALRPIYTTVGGNPLAMRLVVGQTHIYPLASILDHLQKARGQTAENLYTYIYRQAWDGLDAASQDVLLVMPLVNPNGDTLAVIAEVGGLAEETVHTALQRLVMLNLVDVRGSFAEHHYSIHGLTRTFLHEQVLRWQMA